MTRHAPWRWARGRGRVYAQGLGGRGQGVAVDDLDAPPGEDDRTPRRERRQRPGERLGGHLQELGEDAPPQPRRGGALDEEPTAQAEKGRPALAADRFDRAAEETLEDGAGRGA